MKVTRVLALMGRDQWGNTIHLIDHKKPRKSLAEKLGVNPKNLRKQYEDTKDGQPLHTGYINGNQWVTLYEVTPWEREVK